MSGVVCLDCGHVHRCAGGYSAPYTTNPVTPPFTAGVRVASGTTTTTSPSDYIVTADTINGEK